MFMLLVIKQATSLCILLTISACSCFVYQPTDGLLMLVEQVQAVAHWMGRTLKLGCLLQFYSIPPLFVNVF